jgi:hypothetical protein
MFGVSGAKGMTKFHVCGCGCDERIGELNAVGEGMLFDDPGRSGANGFRQRPYTKLDFAE